MSASVWPSATAPFESRSPTRASASPARPQDRIFEKFYRVDPDMLAGVGGSGLGLYISRESIRRMDGTIAVRSSLGSGSTFVVELPRSLAQI